GDRLVASEPGDEDGQEDHDGDVAGGQDRNQRDEHEDDQGRQPEGDECRLDLAEGGDELDGDTAEDGRQDVELGHKRDRGRDEGDEPGAQQSDEEDHRGHVDDGGAADGHG